MNNESKGETMKHIRTWRERAGLPADYQVTMPSSVEAAMQDEIAELRVALRDLRDATLDEVAAIYEPSPYAEEFRNNIVADVRALKSSGVQP